MKKVQSQGFTLIELIFVLVIITMLIMIAVATYPGLTQSMKMRADTASAKNLTNAVRSWYTDYSTDNKLKMELENIINDLNINNKTVKIQEIGALRDYINITATKPISLLNPINKVPEPEQNFFVGIINSGIDIRIAISIGIDEGVNITPESVVTYDGYSSGIIYIESQKVE